MKLSSVSSPCSLCCSLSRCVPWQNKTRLFGFLHKLSVNGQLFLVFMNQFIVSVSFSGIISSKCPNSGVVDVGECPA